MLLLDGVVHVRTACYLLPGTGSTFFVVGFCVGNCMLSPLCDLCYACGLLQF